MFETLKTFFKKQKETLYFAEYRINSNYEKIQLSQMPTYKGKIQIENYILTIESYRTIQTKNAIEIIYLCSYKHIVY